jgi:hypothetical protein
VQFNHNTVILRGVTAGSLSSSDFLFPLGSTIGIAHQTG